MPNVTEKEYRKMVIKVYEYFEQESQNGSPLLPLSRVTDRAAAALGISALTITRIVREHYGDDPTLTKSDDSATESEDEFSTPTKLRKQSASHSARNILNSNGRNKGQLNIVSGTDLPGMHKYAKTDHKRHAFFAFRYSDPVRTDTNIVTTRTESQKFIKSNSEVLPKIMSVESIKCKKSKTTKKVFVPVTPINLDKLNTLPNTKQLTNKQVLVENIPDNSNIELDDLNEFINPSLLCSMDLIIPDLQEIEQPGNSETFFDEDEIDLFTVVKQETGVYASVSYDKPSSSRQELPVPQKSPKNVATTHKSIAKADFRVGRLKVCEFAKENESQDTEIVKPVLTSNDNLEAIKSHVEEFHKQSQVPTIKSLLISLKEAGLFYGTKYMLLKILADIGFKCQKNMLTNM